MSNKVFISHAHKDNHAAKLLAEKLNEKGVQTFLDEIPHPGESWDQQIKDNLFESSAVIVILGAGEPSSNVLVEAGMALMQGKHIVPVVLEENVGVNVFSNLQQVHAFGDDGIEVAADQIKNFLSEHDLITDPMKFKF
jgi:hypothetical protein